MNPWQIEIERRLSVMEDKLTGHPSTSPITPFGQKVERLIAYFEKHARNNQKRAKELEHMTDEFAPLHEITQNDRSSYYLSGKADAYARAAEKVREVLGEPKSEGGMALGVYKEPEKWVVESKTSEGWVRSKDAPYTYKQEAYAKQAIKEAEERFGDSSVERRARRID